MDGPQDDDDDDFKLTFQASDTVLFHDFIASKYDSALQ